MDKIKCFKYYLDSGKYNKEELTQKIEESKKDFHDKKIQIEIELNDYGMYIINFYFETKKTIFDKIKISIKNKNKNRINRYYGKRYGIYKRTETYQPYYQNK